MDSRQLLSMWEESGSLRDIQFAATCALTGQWSAASQRLLGLPFPDSVTSSQVLGLAVQDSAGIVAKLCANRVRCHCMCCAQEMYSSSISNHSLQAPQINYSQHAAARVVPSHHPLPVRPDAHHSCQYQLPHDLYGPPSMPFEEEILAGNFNHSKGRYQGRQARQPSFASVYDMLCSPPPPPPPAQKQKQPCWQPPKQPCRQNRPQRAAISAYRAPQAHHEHTLHMSSTGSSEITGAETVQYPSRDDVAAFSAAIAAKMQALRNELPDAGLSPFPGMQSLDLSGPILKPVMREAVEHLMANPAQFQAAVMRCPLSKVILMFKHLEC